MICGYFKVKELENQVHSLQQAAAEQGSRQRERETPSFLLKNEEQKALQTGKHRVKQLHSPQQAASEKDAKQNEKETLSFLLKDKEQKTSPTAKGKVEVEEKIVGSDLTTEVQQALAGFQLSWDADKDKVTPGNISKL